MFLSWNFILNSVVKVLSFNFLVNGSPYCFTKSFLLLHREVREFNNITVAKTFITLQTLNTTKYTFSNFAQRASGMLALAL